MATLGFILIGALFGLVFSLLIMAFIVIRADGVLRDRLREGASALTARAAGRPLVDGTLRSPAQDLRLRQIQEEAKTLQRLLDEEKVARETGDTERRRLGDVAHALQTRLADSQARITDLERQGVALAGEADGLRGELARAAEQLAAAQQEARDLRTELDVARSGDGVMVSQIRRLEEENTALTSRLAQAASR